MRIKGEESKLNNAANPTFSIFNFPFSIFRVFRSELDAVALGFQTFRAFISATIAKVRYTSTGRLLL